MNVLRPCVTAALTLLTLPTALGQGSEEPDPNRPWRLAEALGVPEWFSIKGSSDIRFESLSERLRADVQGGGRFPEVGSNQGLFTRALVEMSVKDRFLEATLELIDARLFSEPADANPTTRQVNTVEALQGYIAGKFTDAFEPNDSLRVQLGRHTMDVGSRRLIARNRYRNTINAFTGVNAQWESADGRQVRAFYTHPVNRLPGDREGLVDGDIETDQERTQRRFYGIYSTFPDVIANTNAEFYYLGLDESDADGLATSNRNIDTFGTRWNRAPGSGRWHWEVESAFQFGERDASSSDTTRLDQESYLHHLTLGYTFEGETKPRLEALFDLASGDRSPNDNENNRFDSLFGVPRFEFGATGLFREIARANVASPGVRFVWKPGPRWNIMALQRFNYLASDRDAWTSTGVVDPTGNSGSHIGNLSEIRVRYDLVPKSVRLEAGVAYHAAGSFSKNAPNGDGRDSAFGYLMTSFWF